GTGLGAALVLDGVTQPLEIAHLPYRDGWTSEELLGKDALDEVGKKRWRRFVFEIVPRLMAAFQVDEGGLGGGNSKLLTAPPERGAQEHTGWARGTIEHVPSHRRRPESQGRADRDLRAHCSERRRVP